MVLLAKALALHPAITNPRVILVTDRVDLDDQIWRTFQACGKKVHRAKSGADLVATLRRGKADVITAVINKFDGVAGQGFSDDDANLFVLVDESHRSQYGAFGAKMRLLFPNACFIGFTGTPLLKAEKATVAKFGDFIHTYSMGQAVADGAVVPLLYEGRMAELGVDQARIDQWFERVTRDLTAEQRHDLKRKFSRAEAIGRAEQRIQQIAYDLTEHFITNVRPTGFKAQLAVESKETALRYLAALADLGDLRAEVVISAPDTREGQVETDEATLPLVTAFWKRTLARFGSEEAYNREIRASFAREDGAEVLIVVDKLLTGFDEPRNAVLYIDKPLREHSLLQAIARVNRLFEGKEFGYVIDYRGVLGELNAALNTYNALADFDSADVAGTIVDVAAEVARLPQAHAVLWDVFKEVPNRRDTEALERALEPEDRRQAFYEALSDYARVLRVALGTVAFQGETPPAQIARYRADFAFFHDLRMSVRQRYAETIDYREYNQKVRTLLDRHVTSAGVEPITALVNIFDREAFAAEVERIEGTAAKADTIANRLKRTITERAEEDPAGYRRFSQLLAETIAAYKAGRLSEAEYLAQVRDLLAQMQDGTARDLPPQLFQYQHARAYYGVLGEALADTSGDAPARADLLAEMAIAIERRIEGRKIRDWTTNRDVHREMMNDIEDYLYTMGETHGLALSEVALDLILERTVEVARQRERH